MWREECGKDKLKWNYDRPEDFAVCFWQKKPKVLMLWIVYRAAIVTYFATSIFSIIIIRALDDSPWFKSVIFLYYWVDFMEITAFVLGLTISVQRYKAEKKNPRIRPMDKMPWHYTLMWFLYTTAAPCALVITIVFCLFIYNKDAYPYLKFSIVTHVCNTICFLIDFSLCAVPFRLLHIYLPTAFCICYGFFTFIYQNSGGTGNQGKIPIYNILDWREPVSALKTCAVHLVCILFAHCAFCMLKLLKIWLKKKRDEP